MEERATSGRGENRTEPWDPIETKLVLWTLTVGAVLLGALFLLVYHKVLQHY